MRRLATALALTALLAGCGQAGNPLGASRTDVGARAAELEGAKPAYPQPVFAEAEADVLYDMATFDAMEQLIARAEHSIRLDYYIFGGPTAKRLAELIIAKHKAGVKVQILLDAAFGTLPELKSQTKPVLEALKAAGVPVTTHSRAALDGSGKSGTIDHNKYFVVDEREALIGSMNLAKKFYNYHDLMIHVRGPVAADMARQFDWDWWYARRPQVKAPALQVHAEPAAFAAPAPTGAGQVRLIGTGLGRKTALEAVLPLIRDAKRSIHLQMHELGDGPVLDALIAAHERGVDVRILLDPGDVAALVPLVHIAPKGVVNAIAVDKLLKARMNVKTYRVDAQFTTAHMKSCVIDGDTLVAGSINWTEGGFNEVAETDLEIHGGRAPGQVASQFASDWVQRGIPAEPPSAVALALCKLYNKR